jgi:hypothetical protein
MRTERRKDTSRPPSRASVAAKGTVLLGCLGIASWVAYATAEETAPSASTRPPTAFTAATSDSGSSTSTDAVPNGTAPPEPPAPVSEGPHPLDLKVAKPGSDEAQIAAVLQTGLLPRSGGAFGADRVRALPGQGPRSSLAVRITYPAGSASSRSASMEGSAYGGSQVYLLLPHGPVDAGTLSYCLRFPAGFDFVKGGKLPGLFGGTVTSGQHIPDGTDGWSTRYMWRRGGAGEVYAYLPTSVAHGTSLGRGAWSITPGRWQCLAQTVVLNTPGVANGSITVRVEGRQVFAAKGLLFRTTPALRIDGVFFSTFFGGGDPSWASPRQQYADFADIAVTPATGRG